MGAIRESANSTFRAHTIDQVPASGDHEPVKSEIIATFGVVEDAVDAARAVADTAAAGRRTIAAVRVRSTGNVAIASELENGDTLNGVTLATGDRVFLGSQTAPAENGIYVVPASGAASRATDADSAAELARCEFLVKEGAVGAGESWHLPLETAAITVGTTALNFVQTNIVSPAQAENEARLDYLEAGSALLPEATDTHAKKVFRDIVISDESDADTYYINYEFSLFAGPLYRWKVRLHSVNRAAEVARWDYQQATDPALDQPETMHLTKRVDAAVVGGTDYGVSALVTIDWSAVEWGYALTTYTDAAATGVKSGKVHTPSQTRAKWTSPAVPASRLITIGSSGDFATLAAAWDYIEYAGFATSMSRTTYPSSHRGIPEAPVIVRVTQAAFSEEVVPFTGAGSIDQSPIRIPHGFILHLPLADTLIYMDTPGNTGPVIEANFSFAIEGEGQIEQRGPGYVIHVDGFNGISKPDVRSVQSILRGVTLRKTYDDTVPIIGVGLSDDQYLLTDGISMKRPTNTSNGPYIAGHNTAGETRPALIHIRNVTSDIAGSAAFLSMNKEAASTIVHGIKIENSDCPRITIGNSAGGSAGYRRIGSFDGITVTGTLAS